MSSSQALTIEQIFGAATLSWGKKYPSIPLCEIWTKDREYLLWACNLLGPGRTGCDSPPPALQRNLITIAHMLTSGRGEQAEDAFRELSRWRELSQEGLGLSDLPRPNRAECLEILSRCTLLGGHCDLDGLFSLAIAINRGKALSSLGARPSFSRLRIFRYSFQNLGEYTAQLRPSSGDTTVIIDFSAHPLAQLNLDHHTTSLSFWDLGSDLPRGIFEPLMPSCPRLLGSLCGLDVPEEIMSGTDLVDGALYKNVGQAADLRNPFVALEFCLSVDTGDSIAKKVVVTLAENNLDPYSVLDQPIWKARLRLVELEMEEQRSYWRRANHVDVSDELVSIADARLAPYSASRFRYLPFERDDVVKRPYIVTIRPSSKVSKVNLGLGQNPFFSDLSFFRTHPINFGALARTIGQGGGRAETASATIAAEDLERSLSAVRRHVAAAAGRDQEKK